MLDTCPGRKPFFVGTYENEVMGTVDVRLHDNREMWATLGSLSARLDPFTRPDALRMEFLSGSSSSATSRPSPTAPTSTA